MKDAVILPVATGMSLMLSMLTIKYAHSRGALRRSGG